MILSYSLKQADPAVAVEKENGEGRVQQRSNPPYP
jgi:hypothetical protein